MLLTSAILFATVTNLSLVKSQEVVAMREEPRHATTMRTDANLARFRDGYGQEFTVIQVVQNVSANRDRFMDTGHVVCRYDKDGVLDQTILVQNSSAVVYGLKSRFPLVAEGTLEGDSFYSKFRFGGGKYVSTRFNGYRARKPFYSLLEAKVLFEFKPTGKPVHVLNLIQCSGKPAVIGLGFTRGYLRSFGTDVTPSSTRVKIGLEPGSTPYSYWTEGAFDRDGNFYLGSIPNAFHRNGGSTDADRIEPFTYDGTPVYENGELSLEAVDHLKSLIPEEWLEEPKED